MTPVGGMGEDSCVEFVLHIDKMWLQNVDISMLKIGQFMGAVFGVLVFRISVAPWE